MEGIVSGEVSQHAKRRVIVVGLGSIKELDAVVIIPKLLVLFTFFLHTLWSLSNLLLYKEALRNNK